MHRTHHEFIYSPMRGILLLESVVAVAIFGAALLIGASCLVLCIRQTHARREATFLTQTLEATLEQVRNLSWTELAAQPQTQVFTPSSCVTGLFGKSANPAQSASSSSYMPVADAAAQLIVSQDPQGNSNVRKIEVTVSYRPYMSKSVNKVNMVTLITKEGINRR